MTQKNCSNSGSCEHIRLDGLNRSLVEHWIKRAESEHDYANKYISIWIAFNHYYATHWLHHRSEEISRRVSCGQKIHIKDKKAMDLLVSTSISSRIYSTLFRTNDNISVMLPINNDISNEKVPSDVSGKTSIKDITISQCFDILYQIRNNLFHGRKDPTKIKRDIELCEFGYQVLSRFLKRLMEHTKPQQQQVLIG
jgi:hypothetical protein